MFESFGANAEPPDVTGVDLGPFLLAMGESKCRGFDVALTRAH